MKKEWFFDRFCGAAVVAYAEDGALAELGVENETEGETLGNIYKGRVANIVAGMQAAFVSCGMDKNCYLPLNEGAARFSAYDGEGGGGGLCLKEDDEVLVQVEKNARGNKGAKVTCDLSFVGKNLIFLPRTDFLGISRKITDESVRTKLLKEADALRERGQGFIIRTAAENATKKKLKEESEYLKRVYRATLEEAERAPVGTAVYRECELAVKVMRDSLGGDVSGIYVGDRELYDKMRALARLRPDLNERKIVFYEGARHMFAQFGLSEQIYRLAEARVPLDNGGYLVINRTEAMTVIDVNTGKFTGDSDLESTVFETNLQAAREVARQVRLRNLAGIVAVDFIDMTQEAHRTAVDAELAGAVASDKAKCRVLPMGELCVTLFTRKRTNNDLMELLLKPCPHCTREGFVLSDRYMAMRLRGEIMECFASGYNAVVIELNRALMNSVLAERYFEREVRGRWKGKRIYMVPHSTWHTEKFTIRGDNAEVLSLPDNAQILY